MEDDYLKNLALKSKIDNERDQQYKALSKERLLKICSTKIRTTMIAALDTVEKKLETLWQSTGKPSNEQLVLIQLYQEMRKEILDKGNQQIRNLEDEFDQYEIHWKRHTLKLPVRNKEK